jgi:hypothetical protein
MQMLRHLALLSLAAGLTVAACDDDDPVEPQAEVYTATLTGANETPPVTTTATGTGTFTVTGNNINYVITIANWPAGRTVSAAHIHNRPIRPDTAAGVLLGWTTPLTTTGGSGTIAATDAQLTAIRAGGTYFNVHSNVNAGGEIRGNLVRQ